jgi:hypothetical protein
MPLAMRTRCACKRCRLVCTISGDVLGGCFFDIDFENNIGSLFKTIAVSMIDLVAANTGDSRPATKTGASPTVSIEDAV